MLLTMLQWILSVPAVSCLSQYFFQYRIHFWIRKCVIAYGSLSGYVDIYIYVVCKKPWVFVWAVALASIGFALAS